MTILHSGTTKKYSENWDNVFSGKSKSTKKAQPKKSAKKAVTPAKKKKSGSARKKSRG